MWIVDIIEPNFDGEHKFKATDTMTGEIIVGRVGSLPPSFERLPKTFYAALKKCIEDFQHSSPPIKPAEMIAINQEVDVKWEDKTEDVILPQPPNPYNCYLSFVYKAESD